MSALRRFLSLGMQDADRRVSQALVPPSTQHVDSYLQSSRVLIAIDGVTRRLESWWLTSAAFRAKTRFHDEWQREDWRDRYGAIAMVLMAAIGVHIALTLWQGPRPGWFWIVVPALTTIFALTLLAASRAEKSIR
jgi:hypothetical protein